MAKKLKLMRLRILDQKCFPFICCQEMLFDQDEKLIGKTMAYTVISRKGGCKEVRLKQFCAKYRP